MDKLAPVVAEAVKQINNAFVMTDAVDIMSSITPHVPMSSAPLGSGLLVSSSNLSNKK